LLLGDPKPLEAQELRWVKPQELYDYQFPPANTPVFDLLVQKKAMF
jgi:A/G-specific adenine glycosylase